MPDSSLCRVLLPDLHPLQLLLPDCVRCSPLASASSLQLLPDCIRFGCCSAIAIASTAAPRLCPLQLLLPDHVRFDCCSLPSACSPSCSGRFQPMPGPNVLEHSSQSSRFKYERSRVTSLDPPHEHPTSVTHRQTHTR